jgi:hypothetical protein
MSAAVEAFVERMKRERVEAGLPELIADAATLSIVAALVGHRRDEEADQ